MSSTTEHEKIRSRDSENARRLLNSAADTTWRMFVPALILVPAGIFCDLKFHTKPWLTVMAAVVGLAISVWLVARQLRGDE
ncbi:MAG TPA: AtpZ/AtpI family protein [Candidatus Saccharimonadia bacterium]|jgi:F0F1-type ATP synthase assembly protein I